MIQINCFYGATAQHEVNKWLEENKENYFIQDIKITGQDSMTKIIMVIYYQIKEGENNVILNVR